MKHPSTFSLSCHVFFACSNKRLRRSFFPSTLSYSRGLPAYKNLFSGFFATCRTSHKWRCRPPTSLWRSTSFSLFTQHIRLQHDWLQSNQSYAPLLYKTANKGQMKPPLSKRISTRSKFIRIHYLGRFALRFSHFRAKQCALFCLHLSFDPERHSNYLTHRLFWIISDKKYSVIML